MPEVKSPPTTNDESTRSQIHAELVRMLYREAGFGIASVGILTLIVASVMIRDHPSSVVGVWVGVNLAILLARWGLCRMFENAKPPPEDALRWARGFALGAFATGLCWGVTAWLFFHEGSDAGNLVVLFVIAGFAAGASRILSAFPPAYYAHLVPLLAPFFIRFLLEGTFTGLVLSILVVFYGAFLAITGKQYHQSLHSSLTLRHEKSHLVSILTAAKEKAESLNDLLQREVEQRKDAQVQAEAQKVRAESANRAKSEFLATMSHEIRTPMNGILGMLQILRETSLDAKQRDFVETAAGAAESLLRILNDILDFSRIEVGDVDIQRVAFSPVGLAAEVTALLAPGGRAKSLTVVTQFDPNVPDKVFGDPIRLRQVLTNMVSNAIKFTESGRVELAVKTAGRDPAGRQLVQFITRDTGIGMSRETIDGLFQPFAPGDHALNRNYDGPGLGLAISRRLTELMGGVISVTSEPGRGSEFVVEFPFSVNERTPAAPPSHAPFKTDTRPLRGRVLIVEDDRVNQRVARLFLESFGLESAVAATGEEALRKFEAEKWDAILMDLQMPEMDGLEASRLIRESERQGGRPPTAIIALTANAREEDRKACTAAGMNDFLPKPIRKDDLRECLRRYLPESGD